MATGKITKRSVDALRAGERDVFLWDTDRAGFGVKCTPGGKRVYILQYRMHGGRAAKVKRFTIGPHEAWTPDAAGKEADRLLRLVGQGVDPAMEKKRARIEANELAFDKYAGRFLEREAKGEWKDRSYGFAESMIRLHLTPHLGSAPLPSITRQDITRLLDNMPADKPALRRNCFAVLRMILRWALGRGDIQHNPLDGFRVPAAPQSRDRVLEEDELRTVWSATTGLPDPFGAFVRLLMVTGQRRNEVAGIEWKELSRDRREWLIPGARTKNGSENLLPLSDLAITELDALADGDTWPRRGLILTTTGKTPISGFSKAKRALDAAILKAIREDDPHAEFDAWRLHDLRRSMATHMQRLRISSDVIEACENRLAGRSKAGSARVYQRHDFGPEKREAMDRWGAFLTGLFADKNNVVPLAKAG